MSLSSETLQDIAAICGDANVSQNEIMATHTTFKVGGLAAVFVEITSIGRLERLMQYLSEHHVPYVTIGRGSDVLVSDRGFDGVVVSIANGLSHVEPIDPLSHSPRLTCQAGLSLEEAAEMAATLSLSGLEFACGIPGTVGGAVYQNAGAYGREMADVVERVQILDTNGAIRYLDANELDFSYRHSKIQDDGSLVLAVTFALEQGTQDVIRQKMDELQKRRQEKQPLEMPSAGSTFKRPFDKDGNVVYVGPMLIELGLQGKQVGGAQVSLKHAGFVVNTGDATAQDVADLIKFIQDKVHQERGIELVPEVHFIGEFDE